MEKDDKQKMGDDLYKLYRKMRDKFKNKNENSKLLTSQINDVLHGKRVVKASEMKKKDDSAKSSQPEKDPVSEALDHLRGTPVNLSKAEEAVKTKNYAKAVDLLRQEIEGLATKMEEKSQIEQQKAVD